MARIAVVNHDGEFLHLMEDALAMEGHEPSVLRYEDGVLDALKTLHPDLVILDIRMDREADGWLVCDKLTLHQETSAIPILVCSTALEELRQRRAWLQKKGIGVLPKPFDLDDLYGCINGMLRSGQPCMVGLDQAS